MHDVRFHSSRFRLVFLLSCLFIGGSGKLDLLAQNTSATTTKTGTSEPPKSPSYYLEKYGTLPVPAILNGKDHIIIDGWIEALERGRIIKGVTKQGAIRYRTPEIFHLEPISQKGYRINGGGFQGQISPNIQLSVGNSYVFKMKHSDQETAPILIQAPDPKTPNSMSPYKGFELLNNDSPDKTLWITPTQDSPEEMEYSIFGHQVISRGKITIIKTPDPEAFIEDPIHLQVIVYPHILSKHYDLCAEGFYSKEIKANLSLMDLYSAVVAQFDAKEEWLRKVQEQDDEKHNLLYSHTNPTPLMKQHEMSELKVQLLETRKTRTIDENGHVVDGTKYLIKYENSPDVNIFLKSLIRAESRHNERIRNHLKIPDTTYKTVLWHIKVGSRSMQQAKRDRDAFNHFLAQFSGLSLEHAVNHEIEEEAKALVAMRRYDEAIKLLRPYAYPLIKLASIPSHFGSNRITNFKEPVLSFLRVTRVVLNLIENHRTVRPKSKMTLQ